MTSQPALPDPIDPGRFEIRVEGDTFTGGVLLGGGTVGYVARVIDRETGRPQKSLYTFTWRGAYAEGERYVEKIVAGKKKIK
ncbi:hypothetical protein OV450_3438 [Actinobacteria bacterium OV450]|nr:hypothetical protein OV450_3438 [Actinobacteria bacterium OV450]